MQVVQAEKLQVLRRRFKMNKIFEPCVAGYIIKTTHTTVHQSG